MTVVAMASYKGAPGVTTLACLVGATWPGAQSPTVVECDPAGGDLAARFGLAGLTGWSSLVAAVRRPGAEPSIADHLQQLPGGLDVLVGVAAGGPVPRSTEAEARAERLVSALSPPGHLLVDLGRLPGNGQTTPFWLARADRVCLVARADAASAMHVLARSETVGAWGLDRVGLVVVGRGPYRAQEIERLSGVPVLAEVPYDPEAAAVVTDGVGSSRRLARSGLVAAARRLALALAVDGAAAMGTVVLPGGVATSVGKPDPGPTGAPARVRSDDPAQLAGEER